LDVSLTKPCPNCGNHNSPSAIVCKACGINLQAYSRHAEELATIFDLKHEERLKQLESEVPLRKEELTTTYRNKLYKQLMVMVVIGILVAAITYGGGILYQNWQAARIQQANEHYATANECFSQEDYQCALEQAKHSLRKNRNQPGAESLIASAHFKVGQQALAVGYYQNARDHANACLTYQSTNNACKYLLCEIELSYGESLIASRNWRAATAALKNARPYCPATNMVFKPLKIAYDGWLTEVVAQDKFFMVLWVYFLREQSLSQYIFY
jgi:tetratricopeptide (TPR) repeat protein